MSHWVVGVCISVIFLYIKYMAGTEYNHGQGRMTEIQIHGWLGVQSWRASEKRDTST